MKEKEVFYINPVNKKVEVGLPIDTPNGFDNESWMCSIKIDKNHFAIFSPKQLIDAQIEAIR